MDAKKLDDNLENIQNPLGVLPTGRLLVKFAIPSIVSMIVSALYNIVDQYFIGNKVGELGNAATNISFPLTTACVAISLLLGVGGAASFNLKLGAGEFKQAKKYFTNSVIVAFGLGLALTLVTSVALQPMIHFFGSPDGLVFDYACQYTRITAFGYPFMIFTVCGGTLVRADGRPSISMICNIIGAVINIILDFLFVNVFEWGLQGAAIATVIAQVISATVTAVFYFRPLTIKLVKSDFALEMRSIGRVLALGTAPFVTQVAMMIVQIVMNNVLKNYGAQSVYGEAIPIACVGIISKINMLFMSFIIGLTQGLQPIVSFNQGAKNYDRTKRVLIQCCTVAIVISFAAFSAFQLFPRQIIGFFGEGTEEYFQFSINYFRIFLFFTFLNFFQPLATNFMAAIGKPMQGGILALTRQVIVLLPLIIVLPMFFGIDGVMYAGPISDLVAFVVALIFVIMELKKPEYRKKKESTDNE